VALQLVQDSSPVSLGDGYGQGQRVDREEGVVGVKMEARVC